MEQIVFLLKILIYILYLCLLSKVAQKGGVLSVKRNAYYANGMITAKRSPTVVNMSRSKIFVLSVLFGLYSMWVSVKPYASDRGYYALVYGNSTLRYQLPSGFAVLSDALYSICSNPDFLFFSISFLMVLIVLCVYRTYEYSNITGLLLLFGSSYFIYGFHLLKQGIAVAVGTVALHFALKKKNVLAVALALFAVTFHESALILFPIFILFIGSKSKWKRALFYIGCILFVVGFGVLSQYISTLLMAVSPYLAQEIEGYFDGLGVTAQSMMTALKGIPVYIIIVMAMVYRKKISDKIANYDKYLILSVVTAVTYLLSAYMYWMYRFGLFGIFFVYMFYGKIMEYIPNKQNKICWFMLVVGITVILNIRYLFQMFFNFGGF